MAKSGFAKATFNLPIDELSALKTLAESNCITVTTLLRRAIGTELYLSKLERSGGKVLIEENGVIRQIVRSMSSL